MSRNYNDWLQAFVEFASVGEAHPDVYYWVGVVTLAGALQRRVWVPQLEFDWFSNFYVVIVGPPGIFSKTTTINVGMRLLKEVPGVVFGPKIATWPALARKFAQAKEVILMPSGEELIQSSLTIASGEFGNLFNPSDREMVDFFVSLWDGGDIDKITKGNGEDHIENPWLNLIACTTPTWIAGTFPEYLIGGGFTSRCLFIVKDEKESYVAYQDDRVLQDPTFLKRRREQAASLIEDLTHLTSLKGPYEITEEARVWGRQWYEDHYKNPPQHLTGSRFGGYLARKQTHIHKLAMIIAASRGDELIITLQDLQEAYKQVSALEKDLPKVFALIGRSELGNKAARVLEIILAENVIPMKELYNKFFLEIPDMREFETLVLSAAKAGFIAIEHSPEGTLLAAKKGLESFKKNSLVKNT